VRGEIEIDAAGQLTAVAGLGQMPAQPGAEPVELGVLQVPEFRRAQRPAQKLISICASRSLRSSRGSASSMTTRSASRPASPAAWASIRAATRR
jgi:hypothetical protein